MTYFELHYNHVNWLRDALDSLLVGPSAMVNQW